MQTIQEQLRGKAAGEEAVAQQEALLEELVEIVENIDFARGSPLFISARPDSMVLLSTLQLLGHRACYEKALDAD